MTGRQGRDVAITGIGAITPAGAGVDALWTLLCSGESTAGPVSALETGGSSVTIACQVPDGPAGAGAPGLLGRKASRRADRFTQLASVAAAEAVAQAGLAPDGTDDALGETDARARPPLAGGVPRDRAAVVVGTGIGGITTILDESKKHLDGRPTNPLVIPMVMPNAAAAGLAMSLGWTGPNITVATACASGAHAIGEGARLIRRDEADVVLAGGAEAPIHLFVVGSFAALTALSTRNHEPRRASRPFDVARDGFVMGEGAAFCVLEPLDAARARGAAVLGVLHGYGRNTDAHHLVMPEPEGAGAAACMRLALADAGLGAVDIGSVSAHGTSTPFNDLAEAKALTATFGGRVPPVTATKGGVGHLIGAAGAVQVVVALRSLAEGAIPPTANLDDLDPAIDLDIVRVAPRTIAPAPILSNSFAFGGHNACLVIGPA